MNRYRWSSFRTLSPLVALVAFTVTARGARDGNMALKFLPPGTNTPPLAVCRVPVTFPGQAEVSLLGTTSHWTRVGSLSFTVALPPDAPTNAQVMVYLQDWNYLWYQNLLPGHLTAGATNRCEVELTPEAAGWEAGGHHATWNLRALMKPKQFGIRVFSDEEAKTTCTFGDGRAHAAPPRNPPDIRFVKANADKVPVYERFELSFMLPDAYPNPFDPDEVSATAEFVAPSGRHIQVDAFYGRNFYRLVRPTGERFVPQGPPFWRVRFAPTETGTYTYTLSVRDRVGSARWGPGRFDATPPTRPGFVHVAATDPRYFEFSNGAPFTPLGHNTRSPFDARMDLQFPWKQRFPEGTSVYDRYFRTMQDHGENMAEVWTAAWSLGLEWSETQPGYHGVGQYNMRNAWELDGVIALAERYDIYVNIVIHNHGKFSTYWDPEWQDNPFNAACGGFLKAPEEYFTDPRALRAFRQLMRYMVARWGYSPNVFAWQLWSELDLVGTQNGFLTLATAFYGKQEAVDWHKLMGAAIKDMDPYDHMISTHVCNDYSRQNPAIIDLPELDLSCVDAYYHTGNPLDILALLQGTAAYNNRHKKPVMVTEFGGSPHAGGLRHLTESLHLGLWSSVGYALGGFPMYWWWQLVEEQNMYREFALVNRFMAGEDRRDPAMLPCVPALLVNDAAQEKMAVSCLRGPTYALGWICNAADYNRLLAPPEAPTLTNLVMRVDGMAEGAFGVEFWDTSQGNVVTNVTVQSTSGVITAPVPSFARDIAFKIKARP